MAPVSVDSIITHPPHGREPLPLLADLAAFAAHELQPSGALVVLSGMEQLPETLGRLNTPSCIGWPSSTTGTTGQRDNHLVPALAPDPAAAQVIAGLREARLPAPAGGRRH